MLSCDPFSSSALPSVETTSHTVELEASTPTAVGSGGATLPRRPSASNFLAAMFGGRAGTAPEAAAPEGALLYAQAEAHAVGVVGDRNSCKIFGSALVWLTHEELAIEGHLFHGKKSPRFTWRLEHISVCRTTRRFKHGDLTLKTEKATPLLELQGSCKQVEPPQADEPSDPSDRRSKMAQMGKLHFALRGLSNLDEWIEAIRGVYAMGSRPDSPIAGDSGHGPRGPGRVRWSEALTDL